MAARWPNYPHWERLVSTFQRTDGSAWRTAGAALLGCEKSTLRALVDRNMHPDDVRKLDALLVDHLHRYAEDLRRRADDACYSANAVGRAANEVSSFDIDAWMRECEPLDEFAHNAIAELLEDA
ncbi:MULTISPECIES: hypothetical protein [unclassified Bradyrhizobium]|uniref:hypothetical protein n=1 Tax=unclassified Bradyrhizobium TaxID=2631580 RepID=UPI002FF2C8CB